MYTIWPQVLNIVYDVTRYFPEVFWASSQCDEREMLSITWTTNNIVHQNNWTNNVQFRCSEQRLVLTHLVMPGK